MSEVITVTLNPAIDHTVHLKRFEPGKVNRVDWSHRQAGGKGVNVAALLAEYGLSCEAMGFLGQENPQVFETLFSTTGVKDHFIRIPGETRTGIKIIDDGEIGTTDLNFSGLEPDEAAWRELGRRLRDGITPGVWVAFGGSLPPGDALQHFRMLLEICKEAGAKIAVDASGKALSLAIDLEVDLIKPNEHELAEVLEVSVESLCENPAIHLRALQKQVRHVILSVGKDGAWFFSPDGEMVAVAPEVEVVATVGAGDALLAGYLAGVVTGISPEERARLATVFAWAALEKVPRGLLAQEEIRARMEHVLVEQ